ncbi:Rossmann-like and DUF2520 domain-containing protein [Thermophagus sp. OGC60D27]|uniref:Rossmann-like and DUF2520 domain-containing protein n=1 Tax=Thermophagus sp. OGC60D27 TaxID=3458415 RepID=UPI0040376387
MTERTSPITSAVIFGSGNVATHLGRAMTQAGITIRQIYSRNQAHARELANLTGSVPITELKNADSNADLWIISVSDDALDSITKQLPSYKGIIVHTAGSIGMESLSQFQHFGVFYPFQTLSKKRDIDYKELPLLVEGSDPTTTQKLLLLASKVSTKVTKADSALRATLHIAAVLSCNFVNHLYTLSADLLENNNLSFDFLTPLIKETTQKILTMPPVEAQTGPAIRNDQSVMNKHLDRLSHNPSLKKIYELMSKSIVQYHNKN